MQLPNSAQEIANVIGREQALYLIGQLPHVYTADPRWPAAKNKTTILYVPKRLNVRDKLVQILGWTDAMKLVREFGGMLIHPANCMNVYRPFRDKNIARLRAEGLSAKIVAEWFDVTERHVRSVVAENPPQARLIADNDNAPTVNNQARQ